MAVKVKGEEEIMSKYKVRNILVALSFAIVPLALSIAPASADTYGTAACHVMLPDGSGLVKPNGAFWTTSNPNVVETEVTVVGGKGCKQTVSVAGWNAPYGSTNFQPYAGQRLVQGKVY